MKYYKLEYNSLNLKETGTQFQSTTGIMGDIQQDFIPYEGKIDIDFQLPEPFLEKKAKETTFLNTMIIPLQFLVFKKYFINFIKDFNIGEFKTWSLKVHHNNNVINDYEMFYLPNSSQKDIIDFKKSKFEINEDWIIRTTIGEVIDFFDYEKYLIELNNHLTPPYLLANDLYLDFSNQKKDLIRLTNMPMTGNGYYISEKLKEEIIKQKFTGMRFLDIEEMDSRIKVIY